MAKPGTKPLPSSLRLLQGGTRSGSKAAADAKREQSIPRLGSRAPNHLSPEVRAHWRYFYKLLSDSGILTVLDARALEILASEFHLYSEAKERISAEGLMIEGPRGGQMWNPYFTQYKHSQSIVLRLLSEFGLNPSTRRQIATSTAPGKSGFDEF